MSSEPSSCSDSHYKSQNASLHPTHRDVTSQGRSVHIIAAHILFTTFIYLIHFLLSLRGGDGRAVCGHLCDVINAGGSTRHRRPADPQHWTKSRTSPQTRRHTIDTENNSRALLFIHNIWSMLTRWWAGLVPAEGYNRVSLQNTALQLKLAILGVLKPPGRKRRRTRCNVRGGGRETLTQSEREGERGGERERERAVNGHDSVSSTAPFTLSISISLVIETFRPTAGPLASLLASLGASRSSSR